ncbi:MAG: ATP-binding protein [Myxococcota bacterium]|nr:ATP-binding protein [Myxococcota bacterium]
MNDSTEQSPALPTDADLAEALLQDTPNGVLVTDPKGHLLLANPAARSLLGITEENIGRPLSIPHPELLDALSAERTEDVEFPLPLHDRELLVRAVPFASGGGRIALVWDVTRLMRTERSRRDFIANASHELRTPTTAITGYAETLLASPELLGPEVQPMVEAIYRNAQRLTDMFEDLLHLSRLDTREGPQPVAEVTIAPIVREVLDKIQSAADNKNITVQAVVPVELRARTDRDSLCHVVANLVENAIKYSHDGAIVTVRARNRKGRVAVEIIDVGCGIAPEHHRRIFERFYRVDKGRSRAAGGTGLGLAIVKQLCMSMGAGIEVRSRPGRGSVFRVLLDPAEGTVVVSDETTEEDATDWDTI